MLEAVADLQDRGYIGPEHDESLAFVFENADPTFLLVRPSRRPSVITKIAELAEASDSMGRYVKDDWTQHMQLGASALARKIDLDADTTVVIAEQTWVRWLDWAVATETRVGALIALQVSQRRQERKRESIEERGRAAEALDEKVGTLRYTKVADYVRASGGPGLVTRQYSMEYETPGTEWLALNPKVAHRLGWTLAAEGLFRWVDNDGALMSESVWWQDGSPSMRPPEFDDEVGHGWLVVVTPTALDQIATLVGATANWIRIERTARDQTIKEQEGFREGPVVDDVT